MGGLDIAYLPQNHRLPIVEQHARNELQDHFRSRSGALIDGQFAHVGKIKGPILRGLSARAPIFHNGSAQTLLDVVKFYEKRLRLHLEPSRTNWIMFNFLSAL